MRRKKSFILRTDCNIHLNLIRPIGTAQRVWVQILAICHKRCYDLLLVLLLLLLLVQIRFSDEDDILQQRLLFATVQQRQLRKRKEFEKKGIWKESSKMKRLSGTTPSSKNVLGNTHNTYIHRTVLRSVFLQSRLYCKQFFLL